MFVGDIMLKNSRITIFIFITLIFMYIGVIGMILVDGGHDLISIFLVTIIMFVFAGCLYKAIFEYKKDTKTS